VELARLPLPVHVLVPVAFRRWRLRLEVGGGRRSKDEKEEQVEASGVAAACARDGGGGGVHKREVGDGSAGSLRAMQARRWSGGPGGHTASARKKESGKPSGSLRAFFAGRRGGLAGHPAPLET
jgi:hypothetical protein